MTREEHRDHRTLRIGRRGALIGGAAIGATALLGSAAALAGAQATAEKKDSTDALEPTAGTWKTWLLSSGQELRVPPPPGQADTQRELDQLGALAQKRDAAALDRITYWDSGSPGYRWNELAISHGNKEGSTPPYRMLALLNVAIYDATIACWDSKYTYTRERPSSARKSLSTAIATPNSPSYPSEHAATAAAAADVLGYLFPNASQLFADRAKEHAQSRLEAGVEYPSDVEAGLKLGHQVAARVIEYARADRSDAVWDGSRPTGSGIWQGEPFLPMMGTWKTWVLKSGDELRPPPPPAWDSPERAAEIAEVKNYKRDAFPFSELSFWPMDPAGRPEPDSGPFSSNQVVYYYAPSLQLICFEELRLKLLEYRLDQNPPRAARAFALVSIGLYDATVASWDAKFHYWTARPRQFDPTITALLPDYPIPDYPSGHATGVGATAAVLSYLFPRDAQLFQSRAVENAASRLWAGIHFRSANEIGLALGRAVAQKVIDLAKADGA